MHYSVLGAISFRCDGFSSAPIESSDLEVLRQMTSFLQKAPSSKVIALVGGKGPDYSYALGEHLSRLGKKILVIRCDFPVKFGREEAPGLLQAWEGKSFDVSIRKGSYCDFLNSGGFTVYGVEILQSQWFKELLGQLKKEYDTVLLWFRGALDSAGSKGSLVISDLSIVTVSGEPTQYLTPWSKSVRVSFVTVGDG